MTQFTNMKKRSEQQKLKDLSNLFSNGIIYRYCTSIPVIHIILAKLLALSPIQLDGGQLIKPNNSQAKSAASTELTRKRSFDVLHIERNEGGTDRSSNTYRP